MALSAIPHVLIAVIVSVYVVLGAIVLQHMDAELHDLPFYEVLLFCYTTLTTIGKCTREPKGLLLDAAMIYIQATGMSFRLTS